MAIPIRLEAVARHEAVCTRGGAARCEIELGRSCRIARASCFPIDRRAPGVAKNRPDTRRSHRELCAPPTKWNLVRVPCGSPVFSSRSERIAMSCATVTRSPASRALFAAARIAHGGTEEPAWGFLRQEGPARREGDLLPSRVRILKSCNESSGANRNVHQQMVWPTRPDGARRAGRVPARQRECIAASRIPVVSNVRSIGYGATPVSTIDSILRSKNVK